MSERHDTVVIGGGQAGLSISHYLREQGREHVILERARLAERWISERWDSLHFQFPNWSLALPGFAYQGDQPHAFAHHADVHRFISDYARFIEAPLRSGVEVLRVERAAGGGYAIITADGLLEADRVVFATGPFQKAKLPGALPRSASVLHIHASRYRNAQQLAPGAVLVVGSGSSGCQIAQELNEQGRTVYLSVGRHRRVQRRYFGRDVLWWLKALGRFDRTVGSLPGRQIPPPVVVSGVDGGVDINLRAFADGGVVLLGKYLGSEGETLHFDDDLEEQLAFADGAERELATAIRDYAQANGIQTDASQTHSAGPRAVPSRSQLNLRAAGIGSIVWSTGYAYDFHWVRLPLFDENGVPVQERGVTSSPGAYFLGLHWMHKFQSGTLWGVGEDAHFIAEHMLT